MPQMEDLEARSMCEHAQVFVGLRHCPLMVWLQVPVLQKI